MTLIVKKNTTSTVYYFLTRGWGVETTLET